MQYREWNRKFREIPNFWEKGQGQNVFSKFPQRFAKLPISLDF